MASVIRAVASMMLRSACASACLVCASCAFGGEDALQVLYQEQKNPVFIAAGDRAGNAALVTSQNGILWFYNIIPGALPGSLYTVIYGKNVFFSAGNVMRYFMSLDGLFWAEGATGSNVTVRNGTYGNNLFVSVGWDPMGAAIFASLDGIEWTSNLINLPGEMLLGVVYGADKYVAVGSNYSIYVSPNGFHWSANVGPGSSDGYSFTDVAFGNGTYVAVGNNNGVTVSKDGLVWSPVFNLPPGGNLLGVAFGEGRFVAVGSGGGVKVFVSADGLLWNAGVFSRGEAPDLTDVTVCRGTFVAVGLTGAVASSSDGVIWQKSSTIAGSPNLYGVTCRH